MDLSGHRQFLGPIEVFDGELPVNSVPAPSPGPALLLAAWSALQSMGVEAVDLHLRSGAIIPGAVRLRLSGPIAQASTRRDGWTHMFPVEDLALVRLVPRGGRRS
jgi:hypothetical protein